MTPVHSKVNLHKHFSFPISHFPFPYKHLLRFSFLLWSSVLQWMKLLVGNIVASLGILNLKLLRTYLFPSIDGSISLI